jgi:hypothetical protein
MDQASPMQRPIPPLPMTVRSQPNQSNKTNSWFSWFARLAISINCPGQKVGGILSTNRVYLSEAPYYPDPK